MQNSRLSHVAHASRLLLGFLFIYHGLVPKILWLSEVEVQLVSATGLGIPAGIFSPLAGIGEIALGCAIILSSRSNVPVYVAAAVLLLLLLFVGLASPEYLVEAFNPVTTNVLGLGFCYLIVYAGKGEDA